jgi:phosphoglucomutase
VGPIVGSVRRPALDRATWFDARPSGTEDVYKIYAEFFRGPDHLAQVQAAAREVVAAALA